MGGWERVREADRRLLDRIVAWDQRFTRRLKRRLRIKDVESMPPDEKIGTALHRGRLHKRPPIVTSDADFLRDDVAEQMLVRPRRLPPSARMLCARGILQDSFTTDGTRGVTRSLVEAELHWRVAASRWRRFTRAVDGVLHWL